MCANSPSPRMKRARKVALAKSWGMRILSVKSHMLHSHRGSNTLITRGALHTGHLFSLYVMVTNYDGQRA